jgi:NitT/TauT family transport system permease protein
MILLGSSNFTISLVIAGIAIVMVMVLVFNLLVSALERFLGHWERS